LTFSLDLATKTYTESLHKSNIDRLESNFKITQFQMVMVLTGGDDPFPFISTNQLATYGIPVKTSGKDFEFEPG
jgi:hypothetical protein